MRERVDRSRLCQLIGNREGFLHGSLIKMTRICGKATCKCQTQEAKHESYYIGQTCRRKTRMQAVPRQLRAIGFDIEVKARASFQPLEWLRQANKRTAVSNELAAVVCRMNGQGETAEDYLAFMRFGDLVQLLIKAGYTDFQADTDKLEPVYCTCGNTIMKGSPCHVCEKLDNAKL